MLSGLTRSKQFHKINGISSIWILTVASVPQVMDMCLVPVCLSRPEEENKMYFISFADKPGVEKIFL